MFVLAGALAFACNETANDQGAAAGEGSDSAEVTSDEGSTLSMVTDGAHNAKADQAPATDVQVAAYMAVAVGANLQPPSCKTITVNGATVTYVFNDCAGPRGLVHLTGTLTVTYSVDNAGIHAAATASNFHVNQSTLNISATSTYSYDAATTLKTLAVQTNGSGTGPLGNTFAHTGNYTVTWDMTCVTLNGMWSTTTGTRTRSTTVTNLKKCQGHCPSGTISHTFAVGSILTITFDGSAVAQWTLGQTVSGTVALTCTPN
jgi:hypothetical protein